MSSPIYWIDGPWSGRLGILPRPRGGDWLETEIQSWKKLGLDTVVSLLTPDEIAELDLDREAHLCEDHAIDFSSFGINDRSIPTSQQEAFALTQRLQGSLNTGSRLGIHCRQGIGRSGMIATCLLILSGVSLEEALARVSQVRGCEVPETAEQRDWLARFAARLHQSLL